MIDRYFQAGLTQNPFTHRVVAANPDATFVGRGLGSPPPPASHTLVQVIGDKGAGKTTQVQSWRRRVDGPYHYIPESPYRARWAEPPVGELVYGDEIDRMPSPLRHRWFQKLGQRCATVVIGTHVDLSTVARRHGFVVVTHKLGAVDIETLRKVIDTRLTAVASAPDGTADCPGDRGVSAENRRLRRSARAFPAGSAGPSFSIDDRALAEIHALAAGSLRTAETLLHQYVAGQVEKVV